MQKQTGYMNCHSGMLFLMKKRKNSCTVSRNSPVRSAKERKSEEMIHVHAEVVKNIKCAVEEMHSSISYERELG